MIQPLRAWHRRAMFVLAPLLPAIFAAGLVSRPGAAPLNPDLESQAAVHEWRAPVSLKLGNTNASVARSADGGWLRIEIDAGSPQPDLLVYWSAAPPAGTSLPSDARLLGTPAEPVRIPERAGPGSAIVVYSLPHQQLAGSFRLEDLR